jgi:hypothetical protein
MYGKIGTVISSGSKAEGLDLKGSDYDIMHVFTQCQVYENVNAIGKMTNKIHLIMDADDSPPGFTLLQLLDTRQRFNIFKSYRYKQNTIFLYCFTYRIIRPRCSRSGNPLLGLGYPFSTVQCMRKINRSWKNDK